MAYDYDRLEGEERGSAFLMGLFAGTVLGAGLGMLFAPRPGNELRTQLSETASRAQRTATERYQDASTKVGHMVDRGRETYEKVVHKGREAVDRGREAYSEVRRTGSEPDVERFPTEPPYATPGVRPS